MLESVIDVVDVRLDETVGVSVNDCDSLVVMLVVSEDETSCDSV